MVDLRLKEPPLRAPVGSLPWIEWFTSVWEDLQNIITDLDNKLDTVTATAGNLIQAASDGSLEDSGVAAALAALVFEEMDNISDASAVSTFSATSGSDQIDLSDLNTKLTTLTTEINALKDKVNAILAELQDSNIMSS